LIKGDLIKKAGNMSISLLIVDDNDNIRKQIKSFVSTEPDIKVVGEAKDGESAVLLARKLSPDLVLMDITMPKMSGIEAAAEILKNNALIRVTILSIHSDKHFVEAALKAGVLGYVLKTSIKEDLIPAIRAVMANKPFLSPQITDIDIVDYIEHPPKADNSASES
jgi:DNA-binding NarL/FixJ family response regulator